MPPTLLRAGSNTIQVRLDGSENLIGSSYLSAVVVGEQSLVQAQHAREVFVGTSIPRGLLVVAAVIGLLSLTLWLRRPSASMYGYLGLAVLVWIPAASPLVMEKYPAIPTELYWDFHTGVAVLGSVLLFLFASRYARRRWTVLEYGFGLFCVAAPVLQYIDVSQWIGGERNWSYLVYVVIPFATTVVMGLCAWRRRTLESFLLALAVLWILLVQANWLLSFMPESQRILIYSVPPMFVVIGWMLVDRFARSLNESEKLNAELEQRVAHKHAELEQNYQRVRELEQQQAVINERQRIMTDMHDGIGGQLITALNLVEQGESPPHEVAAALRECIDDLRMVIDSLEPAENDLLLVLGKLRYRLEGRLRKQGIDLDWQVKDVPQLASLTPQNVLQILRIVQEMFTNVLKHARASIITVRTGVDEPGEHVYIRVTDNGSGFHDDHTGHGLANMRRRAKTIGALLEIFSSPAGTTLNLLLPVAP